MNWRAFVALSLLCLSHHIDATVFTWSTGSGSFNVPANWMPAGGPPGINDVGLFTGFAGTVTLTPPGTAVGTFQFNAGTPSLSLTTGSFIVGNGAGTGVVMNGNAHVAITSTNLGANFVVQSGSMGSGAVGNIATYSILNQGALTVSSAGESGGAAVRVLMSPNASFSTLGAATISDIQGGILHLSGPLILSNSLGNASVIVGPITNNGGLGSLVLTNGAVLTLVNPSNSYSGGTVISSGVLNISTAGNIGGPTAGFTLDGGSLVTSGPVTTIGNVNVTNSSTINAAGGAVTLLGTLTGFSASTLSSIGALSLNTVDVGSGTFTILGNLSGSQMLTKKGVGTLQVTGTNSYTGGTTISAGVLSISGDYTPASSEILAIGITPSSNASFQIGGNANLNGNGKLQIDPAAGSYTSGTTYTILTGNVSGEFASTNLAGLFPNLTASLIYHPTSIELLLMGGGGGGSSVSAVQLGGLSGNNLALAKYLNKLSVGTLGSPFTALAQLSGSALNKALAAISPSRNSDATYVSQINMFTCNQVLNATVNSHRFYRENRWENKQVAQGEFEPDELMVSVGNMAMKKKKCTPAPPPPSPYSVWATGFGDLASLDARDQNPRFNVSTGGVMVGFDYGNYDASLYKQDAAVFGAALAFTHSNLKQGKHFGKSAFDTGYLALYGTMYFGNFYLDTAWWNGVEHVKNTRNVFYPGFSAKARSSYNCYIGDVHAASGYDYHFASGNMTGILEPFIALDWAYSPQKSYSEHGAGPFNMHQKSRFSSMLQTEVGVNTYFNWIYETWLFNMVYKLSYINRAPFNVGKAKVNIVGAPGAFTVSSFTRNQSLFSPGVQLTWRANKGAYLTVGYDGEFGSGWMLNEVLARVGVYF